MESATVCMACWPGHWGLVLRSRPEVAVLTSASIDIISIREEFEVLGGGDIGFLSSALNSPDVPCIDLCDLKKEDVLNKEGMGIFGRHPEYLPAMIRKKF